MPTSNIKRKVLVTGGAGYVGSVLVPSLINKGFHVTILDLMIYGEDVVKKSANLNIVKGDIRDTNLLKSILPGHTDVIHLACISNDPSFELNPTLGKSINLNAFRPLVEISLESKINRFIYASSSSVYGVKKELNVHENVLLEPLTDYSLFKVECEKILSEYYSNDFICTTVRPATVCGYAPRQRLDVVVNILTNLAYNKRMISVFGGDQLRPNIHIKDMVNAYLLLLDCPKEKIAGKIFNAGYENQSVSELAETVKNVVGDDVKIIKETTDDNRSYHISSQKIKKELGFVPEYNIKDAVIDLVNAFKKGLLPNSLLDEKYLRKKTFK